MLKANYQVDLLCALYNHLKLIFFYCVSLIINLSFVHSIIMISGFLIQFIIIILQIDGNLQRAHFLLWLKVANEFNYTHLRHLLGYI